MKTTGRKNPALVELVLVILFLAMSAVVLVQVFVKAHTLSADSRAQTTGLVLAQDIIEQWKTDPASADVRLFGAGWQDGAAQGDGQLFTTRRDADMCPLTQEGPGYALTVLLDRERTGEGVLYRIRVTLISLQDPAASPLVDCETAQYAAKERVGS